MADSVCPPRAGGAEAPCPRAWPPPAVSGLLMPWLLLLLLYQYHSFKTGDEQSPVQNTSHALPYSILMATLQLWYHRLAEETDSGDR